MFRKSAIAVLVLSFVTSSVFASEFKKLSSPTNLQVATAYPVLKKIPGAYIGVYKITKKTEKPGRTAEEAHIAAIKESMHKYMCSLFDESINITRDANTAKGVDDALKDLDLANNASDVSKQQLEALRSTLIVANSSPKIELYSGDASGNNTAGNVMGIYDTVNDEVLYYGFTNCGSDD